MSSPLAIITWIWGDLYDDAHVTRLFNGIERHLTQPHRRICFSDRRRPLPAKIEQLRIPNPELVRNGSQACCARLRLFDLELQRSLGLTGRIVDIDLDCVVVGELDDLFDKPNPFTIMQEVNVRKNCPFAGSLYMLQAGYRPDVWSVWETNRMRGRIERSDETWLFKMIPDAASWTGRKDGVWSYRKGYWEGPRDPDAKQPMPPNAKIIFFTGRGKKPLEQYMDQKWFADNWK